MSPEDKYKLILMLQNIRSHAKSDAAAKEKEKKEILGKLDALLEGQSSSKKQIYELTKTNKKLNATIKKLSKELGKKQKNLLEKEKLFADLRDQLSSRSSVLFGSRSRKGGTTRKAAEQKIKEKVKDDFNGSGKSKFFYAHDTGDKHNDKRVTKEEGFLATLKAG